MTGREAVVSTRWVACIRVTLFRHCRSMEMHYLPLDAAFRDHKRDATISAERRPISHTGHCIQASKKDRSIRQYRCDVAVDLCASWPVIQECLLEICTNLFRLADNRLATGAQESGIRGVQLDDAINIRIRKCLGPFLQYLKRIFFRSGGNGRAKRSKQDSGKQQFMHVPLL